MRGHFGDGFSLYLGPLCLLVSFTQQFCQSYFLLQIMQLFLLYNKTGGDLLPTSVFIVRELVPINTEQFYTSSSTQGPAQHLRDRFVHFFFTLVALPHTNTNCTCNV